jgi:hypothetical protein
MTARRALPLVLLAVGVLLIGLLTRDGRGSGEPLDPKSTEPLGARALVLLLEEFGAGVRVTGDLPPEGGTALLLRDQLGVADTRRLSRWVERGGTLVVADPLSDLAPALARPDANVFSGGGGAGADGELVSTAACGVPALREVRRLHVPGAAGYRLRPGDTGCFPAGTGSFVVARDTGDGVVVSLGGGGGLVNSNLDRADNAGLAVALMAPEPGAVVHVLRPSAPGSGQRSLVDLVSRRVKDGLWQLLLAFGLFAMWRARRLGRPLEEPQPVEIAGSELVVAVGNLLHQGRRRDAAASMIRSSLRRTLVDRLGLPADTPPEALAQVAAARTGVEASDVVAALSTTVPVDDAALVALARSVESLRNEVAHVR